jgi:hypothetical protein
MSELCQVGTHRKIGRKTAQRDMSGRRSQRPGDVYVIIREPQRNHAAEKKRAGFAKGSRNGCVGCSWLEMANADQVVHECHIYLLCDDQQTFYNEKKSKERTLRV